jgi:UDP-N-acetylglucosamine diphosphorylase / glucose-1-phosphate thymidylyltransferase / UDP-N-acetylgalactosamine diphosphorylase / glucosamine-1-phosphate N-acetyltransferase / galactosamine-1-phosphate N-acetyltransferase
MIVVIPMAGRGSRYSDRGYQTPKPLIEVAGKPMVLWALKSLEGLPVSKYIFVVLKEHEEKFNVKKLVSDFAGKKSQFVLIDDITEGQLCTVLEAKESIDTDEDVLIASSDTFVLGDLNVDIENTDWDGIISVANLPGDRWSFAKTNDRGEVIQVTEKVRISNNASTGLYYFRKGRCLVDFASRMITNKEKTRGEYYVIPVYEKMIEAGLRVGISVAREMWDMGTPEAKAAFEKKFQHR